MHFWNVIKLDNKWYFIETTWSAGYYEKDKYIKRFEPFWFLTPPEQFIYFHLPNEKDIKW